MPEPDLTVPCTCGVKPPARHRVACAVWDHANGHLTHEDRLAIDALMDRLEGAEVGTGIQILPAEAGKPMTWTEIPPS
ncbi:hypothetical protein ABZ312_11295 [Streptomyces sp. NPDC006207]